MGRVGSDPGERVAVIEFVVGQPGILAAEDQGDRPFRAPDGDLLGCDSRPEQNPFGAPLPGCERNGIDTVRGGSRQGVEDSGPGDHVAGVVGDSFNPVGIEHGRLDQPEKVDAEVLGDPDGARDVHEVLGLHQDDDRGGGHPSFRKSRETPLPLSDAVIADLSTALR